jgi:hypothetical protein
MSQISINPHGGCSWRMDEGGYCVIAVRSVGGDGKIDGINLKGSNGQNTGSDVWLSLEEAKSLRDWLNKSLDIA